MKNLLKQAMGNPILTSVVSLITYVFYGVVIGISLFPSVLLVKFFIDTVQMDNQYLYILSLAIIIGISIYLFFISALLVFGIVERLLIIGNKPGRYSTNSFIFIKWLVYSGLHVILLNLVLPYVSGTVFAKIFYRILGCKIGKNVFINTVGLHDAYLLEIDDNVVIGGDANISCHIFEGNHLILNKIKIGNNTLVSAESYIMPGAEIGSHCNIGIKSYVRKNRKIDDNSMIMALPGLPSKKVAELMKNNNEEVKS